MRWDGDKVSELLDFTRVEKSNPATWTGTGIFDPSGEVSGARNATPFYGDPLGDWREEGLAGTAEHSALRLCATTEPTEARHCTLARTRRVPPRPDRARLSAVHVHRLLPRRRDSRVPRASITFPEGAVSRDDHP